ncbi:MAG: hypothetical protein IT438_02435 [Phycisphaerales bacterium]|nr:hypothetical protein [Phycisphaerales bacterium]
MLFFTKRPRAGVGRTRFPTTLFALGLLAPAAAAVPPPNDECFTATILPESVSLMGTTVDATTSIGGSACGPSANDVFYAFTPALTEFYVISLCETAVPWDTVLSLHSGCPATTLNEIVCNDNTCDLHAQLDAVKLTAGTPYTIRVAGKGPTPPPNPIIIRARPVAASACCTKERKCTWTSPLFGACPANKIARIDGTTCANPKYNPCMDKGACCVPVRPPFQEGDPPALLPPSSSCVFVTPQDCAALGGFFFGVGISCEPSPCGEGACCLPDLTCTVVPPAECDALGGNFVGAGTDCMTGPCFLGACCDPLTGLCFLIDQPFCETVGGFPQGQGTTCNPDPCFTGACCDTGSGPCITTVDPVGCQSIGGVFLGYGSSCALDDCLDIGACCIASTEACFNATAERCANHGGNFLGIGTVCQLNISYLISPGSNPFTPIAGLPGTVLLTTPSNCDDCGQTVTLPFQFAHISNVFESVWVCSNGFIQFGGANNSTFANVPIPDLNPPNNTLCPLWDDFNPLVAGDVFARTDGVAPSRTFTISWENVTQFGLPVPDSFSFQIVLHEFTSNVEFRYGSITPEPAPGDFTIGYENAQGTAGGSIPGNSLGSGHTAFNLTRFGFHGHCPAPVTPAGACCCGASCRISTPDLCIPPGSRFAGPGTVCVPYSLTIPCCRGDFTQNNNVSVQDLFDFLAAYFANDPCANANDSPPGPGAPNGLSVQDLFDFLAAYFGAC